MEAGGLKNPPPIEGTQPIRGGGVNGEGLDAASRASIQDLLEHGIKDREHFSAETVHFDFDSSVVKPGDIGKIETVAKYLVANPSQAVIVEGHCDERGTEEYNRALGERRALSVREALVRAGADAGRIHTLSMGEDVPVATGHNEAAWSQNRRGEFVLLRPNN
jgi:peptidoglycan-associated lipoprotein